MIYLTPNSHPNSESGNSYLQHFQIAHKNLMMVLEEQKSMNLRERKRPNKKVERINYSIE
jgi:hypothetical protein